MSDDYSFEDEDPGAAENSYEDLTFDEKEERLKETLNFFEKFQYAIAQKYPNTLSPIPSIILSTVVLSYGTALSSIDSAIPIITESTKPLLIGALKSVAVDRVKNTFTSIFGGSKHSLEDVVDLIEDLELEIRSGDLDKDVAFRQQLSEAAKNVAESIKAQELFLKDDAARFDTVIDTLNKINTDLAIGLAKLEVQYKTIIEKLDGQEVPRFFNIPNKNYVELYGREDYVGVIKDFLLDKDSGQFLIVKGEKGIGKTAIVTEALDNLKDHLKASDTSLTYLSSARSQFLENRIIERPAGAVISSTDHLINQLAVSLGCNLDTFRNFTPAERYVFLQNNLGQRDTVIVIDNFDEFESSDLDNFFSLVNELPVRIVLSTSYLDSDSFVASAGTVLEVFPLEYADMDNLIESTGKLQLFNRDKERIWEKTEGNPQAILSILRSLSLGESLSEILERFDQPDYIFNQYFFQKDFNLLQTEEKNILTALSLFTQGAFEYELVQVAGIYGEKNPIQNLLTNLLDKSLIIKDGEIYALPDISQGILKKMLEESPADVKGLFQSRYNQTHTHSMMINKKVEMLQRQVYYYQEMEDIGLAKVYLEQLLEISKLGGYEQAQASSLAQLGRISMKYGSNTEAYEFLFDSLELYNSYDGRNNKFKAGILSDIGEILYRLNNFEDAQICLEQSLSILAEINNAPGISDSRIFAQNRLAKVLANIDENKAIDLYKDSLRRINQKSDLRRELIIEKAKILSGIASIYNSVTPESAIYLQQLADTYFELDKKDEALFYYKKLASFDYLRGKYASSISNWERVQELTTSPEEFATALFKIGNSFLYQKNLDKALANMEALLNFAIETEFDDEYTRDSFIATAYSNLGKIAERVNNPTEAISYYEKSLEYFDKDDREDLIKNSIVLDRLAYLNTKNGDYWEALKFASESLNYKRSLENDLSLMHTLFFLGDIYRNLGKDPSNLEENSEARRYYEEYLQISKEYGFTKKELSAEYQIGKCYVQEQDYIRAIELFEGNLKRLAQIYPDFENKTRIERDISTTFLWLSKAYAGLGNNTESLEIVSEGLKHSNNMANSKEKVNIKRNLAQQLLTIGSSFRANGSAEQAKTCFRIAQSIYQEIVDVEGIANTFRLINGS